MNNGKNDQLSELFNKHEGPTVTDLETSPDKALITLHVPNQLTWFKGHFPDQKVLPGVVQIDWAGKFSKALFTHSGACTQITNVKFKTMVMPETTMTLELSYNAGKGNIKFHFFSESESLSMGCFKFRTT